MNAPVCQSCSMPMGKESDFGTNKDGGRSKEYCVFCYKKGEFTFKGNLEGMIERLVTMSSKMGMGEQEAREMAKRVLPNLKRWKK